jgi:hypothetical protein
MATFKSGLVVWLAMTMSAATFSPVRAETPFSFRSVEFLPRAQRESAATDFVNRIAAPGQLMNSVVSNLRRAGAYCPKPKQGGELVCTSSSMQRHPGEDLTDIQWIVRVFPNASGAVDHATVVRQRTGL